MELVYNFEALNLYIFCFRSILWRLVLFTVVYSPVIYSWYNVYLKYGIPPKGICKTFSWLLGTVLTWLNYSIFDLWLVYPSEIDTNISIEEIWTENASLSGPTRTLHSFDREASNYITQRQFGPVFTNIQIYIPVKVIVLVFAEVTGMCERHVVWSPYLRQKVWSLRLNLFFHLRASKYITRGYIQSWITEGAYP
jgi:hypothetical protein